MYFVTFIVIADHPISRIEPFDQNVSARIAVEGSAWNLRRLLIQHTRSRHRLLHRTDDHVGPVDRAFSQFASFRPLWLATRDREHHGGTQRGLIRAKFNSGVDHAGLCQHRPRMDPALFPLNPVHAC